MFLTGLQRKELHEALLSAFNLIELEMLVQFTLDKRLEEIVSVRGSSMSEITFRLINWAEEEGRLAELVNGAAKERPNHPKIKEFAADWSTSLNVVEHSGKPSQKPVTSNAKSAAAASLLMSLFR